MNLIIHQFKCTIQSRALCFQMYKIIVSELQNIFITTIEILLYFNYGLFSHSLISSKESLYHFIIHRFLACFKCTISYCGVEKLNVNTLISAPNLYLLQSQMATTKKSLYQYSNLVNRFFSPNKMIISILWNFSHSPYTQIFFKYCFVIQKQKSVEIICHNY